MPGEAERTIDGPPASRWFLIGVALVLLVTAFVLTWPYLGAVVMGLLAAFVLHPVHRRLVPLVRWPTLSATLLMVGFGVVLVAPFVLIAWQTYGQVAQLVAKLQDPDWLRAHLATVAEPLGLSVAQLVDWLSDRASDLASAASGLIVPTFHYIIDLLIGLIVFFFVLFFGLRDGADWLRALKSYTPLDDQDRNGLFEQVHDSVWAIVMGTFVVAAIQGVVAGIGWWLFGFPAPLFWGFVMVILGILPFGAPFLVTVPASIWAVAQGDWFTGIGLLVYTVTVVALTDDLLRPVLVAGKADIPPVLVLVGMLGGLVVFGLAGFILGPLIFALLGPVLDVWARRRRERHASAAATS